MSNIWPSSFSSSLVYLIALIRGKWRNSSKSRFIRKNGTFESFSLHLLGRKNQFKASGWYQNKVILYQFSRLNSESLILRYSLFYLRLSSWATLWQNNAQWILYIYTWLHSSWLQSAKSCSIFMLDTYSQNFSVFNVTIMIISDVVSAVAIVNESKHSLMKSRLSCIWRVIWSSCSQLEEFDFFCISFRAKIINFWINIVLK